MHSSRLFSLRTQMYLDRSLLRPRIRLSHLSRRMSRSVRLLLLLYYLLYNLLDYALFRYMDNYMRALNVSPRLWECFRGFLLMSLFPLPHTHPSLFVFTFLLLLLPQYYYLHIMLQTAQDQQWWTTIPSFGLTTGSFHHSDQSDDGVDGHAATGRQSPSDRSIRD
jgi:hypothetical protein